MSKRRRCYELHQKVKERLLTIFYFTNITTHHHPLPGQRAILVLENWAKLPQTSAATSTFQPLHSSASASSCRKPTCTSSVSSTLRKPTFLQRFQSLHTQRSLSRRVKNKLAKVNWCISWGPNGSQCHNFDHIFVCPISMVAVTLIWPC